MSTGGRRLRPHRITALAATLGVGATVGICAVTRGVFVSSGETQLNQQAAQAAMVLSGYLSQSLSTITALGKAVDASHADPAAFPAAVKAADLEASYYLGAALVKVTPTGGIEVLSRTGHVTLDATDPKVASIAARAVRGGGMHQVELDSYGPLRTRGLMFGAPYAPAGYGIYTETIVMPAFDLSTFGAMPFSNVGIAVYLGTEDNDHAWIRTTQSVATTGKRSVVVIPTAENTIFASSRLVDGRLGNEYDGKLFLVASPRGSLISASSQRVLLTMLLIGCISTLVSSAMLELACRRRDRAMALVCELTEKNAALDLAMQRQAEAEEGLRQAQRMEAVGQLAGGIAHDFNNLLAVILSYAGFVGDALPAEGTGREDLDEITKAARRGAELTRQLLLFSRRDVAQAVAVDVNDCVHDLGRMLARTLGEDIRIVTDLGPSPLVVKLGSGELDQVVMNLAVNARDAMPDGGVLTVRTRRTGSGDVAMTITDTGVGMTAEQISRACEPFYTTKEPGRGTGLGLSSVYGIVTRWGGTIEIDSTKGLGTTVSIVMPACAEEPSTVELPSASTIAPPGTTVLLVEDEPAVLTATRRLLSDAGYEVLTAVDGPSALDVLRTATPDIVVTDVVMPGGMSGPQLVAAIHAERPHLPAIYTSGYPRDLVTDRAVLDTEIPLVEKPFTDETLLTTIARSLHTVETTS
ncbi:MAG TPA: ATP-binding protein [Mycobacteriales bacterium]|nr:ATP-binding protein [Mycobacteriales bacterium]